MALLRARDAAAEAGVAFRVDGAPVSDRSRVSGRGRCGTGVGRFGAAPSGVAVRRGHTSDDVEPFPRDVLNVETRQDSTAPTIIVVGEFDMTGTDDFWAHVSEAVEARPVSLTIEARRLTFVDSSAILRPREAATEAGVGFRVSPSPPLRRLADMSDLEDLLLG